MALGLTESPATEGSLAGSPRESCQRRDLMGFQLGGDAGREGAAALWGAQTRCRERTAAQEHWL